MLVQVVCASESQATAKTLERLLSSVESVSQLDEFLTAVRTEEGFLSRMNSSMFFHVYISPWNRPFAAGVTDKYFHRIFFHTNLILLRIHTVVNSHSLMKKALNLAILIFSTCFFHFWHSLRCGQQFYEKYLPLLLYFKKQKISTTI